MNPVPTLFDIHNLPLAAFTPQGAWVTGTAYARGDLVTVGSQFAVATVAHVAGAWAADLATGRWAVNSVSADWLVGRGVYDPAAVYAVGDGVLYSTDGLRWQLWRASVRNADATPLPVGSAPGSLDASGYPYWSAETLPMRARQLTLRSPGGFFGRSVPAGSVAARRLAMPVSIPTGWAGSGGTIQPAASAALAFEVRVDGVAVATLTIPKGGDHASLVGAGAILIGAGILVELVNTGGAVASSLLAVAIAGTHV